MSDRPRWKIGDIAYHRKNRIDVEIRSNEKTFTDSITVRSLAPFQHFQNGRHYQELEWDASRENLVPIDGWDEGPDDGY